MGRLKISYENFEIALKVVYKNPVHPKKTDGSYYPFGLTMSGISTRSAGKLDNKKKYQQYELNDAFDINLYESFYRSHDPQIGRFLQIDPKPNHFESPFAAMGNNPVLNMDVLGDTSIIYNMGGTEIDRNTTTKGMNYYMVDEGKYNAFLNGNGDLYDNDYSTFEKNMIASLKADEAATNGTSDYIAFKKGQISFEFTGTATDTKTSYSYKGNAYTVQDVRNGVFSLNVNFDNGKKGRSDFDAVSGPWGNGILANGEYVASGFKKESANYWKDWKGVYSTADGSFGFKLMLDYKGKSARGDFRVHPVGGYQSATEGCIGIPTKSSSIFLYNVFSNALQSGKFSINVNLDKNNNINEQIKNGIKIK